MTFIRFPLDCDEF